MIFKILEKLVGAAESCVNMLDKSASLRERTFTRSAPIREEWREKKEEKEK